MVILGRGDFCLRARARLRLWVIAFCLLAAAVLYCIQYNICLLCSVVGIVLIYSTFIHTHITNIYNDDDSNTFPQPKNSYIKCIASSSSSSSGGGGARGVVASKLYICHTKFGDGTRRDARRHARKRAADTQRQRHSTKHWRGARKTRSGTDERANTRRTELDAAV